MPTFNANLDILGRLKARKHPFQENVLDLQTDATLDPGASPTSGDRYILTVVGSLHANFGTITGVGNNDIVEYDGSAFEIVWDASANGEGGKCWDEDSNGFYSYNGTAWSSDASAGDLASLSDTNIAGLASADLLIYDGTDSWDNKPITGDVTISNTGVTAIGATKVTNAMLAGSIADGKLASNYVQTSEVDDSSIEFAGGTLNVKALGITNAMLAGSIADGKLASDYVQTSEVDGSSIEWSGTALQVKALGITDAMLAGSISFSKLSDSANIARLDQTETVAAVWSFGTNLPTVTADPTGANDLVRKNYVDTVISGLDFQPDVLNKQTDASLDPGASPTTGDRYIIEASASLHANFGTITGVGDDDIVEYDGADFVVSYDVSVQGEGAITWNQDANYFELYDGSTWSEFGGLSGVTAGTGLTKSSNTINAIGGDGITANADDLAVDPATEVAGSRAAVYVGADGVGVELDNTTLDHSSSTLQIKTGGVDTTQLATDAVDTDKLDYSSTGLRSHQEAWTNAQGTSKAITHSWGTRYVMVEVYDSSYETVYVDTITRTDTNTVTLTAISAPPSSNDYTVLLKEIGDKE